MLAAESPSKIPRLFSFCTVGKNKQNRSLACDAVHTPRAHFFQRTGGFAKRGQASASALVSKPTRRSLYYCPYRTFDVYFYHTHAQHCREANSLSNLIISLLAIFATPVAITSQFRPGEHYIQLEQDQRARRTRSRRHSIVCTNATHPPAAVVCSKSYCKAQRTATDALLAVAVAANMISCNDVDPSSVQGLPPRLLAE